MTQVILVRLQQKERTLLNVKYPTATSASYLISVIILPTPEEKFHPLLISIAKTSMSRLFSLRSNLALCLVLRILFPILLNHVLFISLHVRAVELVILVKPIGISTHVLMSISFGTKIPTFLNILVLLKVVGISVISLVLRFSIMPALTLSSK